MESNLIQPFPEFVAQVRAGFSTRIGGNSLGSYSGLNLGFRSGDDPGLVQKNWEEVRRSMGLAGKPLVLPKMIHGDGLSDADAFADKMTSGKPALEVAEFSGSPWPPLLEPEASDAIYSRRSQAILAVTMADCLTALIFDPGRRTIAAVHAGWKGTKLGILEKTLRTLAAESLINPEDTLVSFGPCLRVDSLEIGPEVAAQLDANFLIRKENRIYFDMPGCNKAQALKAGIRLRNLRDMHGDTLVEPTRFFSYRRDGQASGRMAAFISLI